MMYFSLINIKSEIIFPLDSSISPDDENIDAEPKVHPKFICQSHAQLHTRFHYQMSDGLQVQH